MPYWPDLIITSQESESGEDKRTGEIDVIFSGQAAGLYSVRMEHEGNLLRGFPVRVILKPCDAHPSKTTVIGLQSKTVVVNTAADCQTTLRLAPKDEYGNPVGPQVIQIPRLICRNISKNKQASKSKKCSPWTLAVILELIFLFL